MLGWALLDLSTGRQCHLIWVLKQSCCTTPMSHLFLVGQLFVVVAGILILPWMALEMHIAHIGVGPGMALQPSLTCNKSMFLKHPILEKNIIIIIVHFLCYHDTGCHVWFLFRVCNKVVSCFCLFFIVSKLIFNFCLFRTYLVSIAHWSFPLFQFRPIVVQFTLSSSGIPRSAGPFLDTIKKLHDNSTFCA